MGTTIRHEQQAPANPHQRGLLETCRALGARPERLADAARDATRHGVALGAAIERSGALHPSELRDALSAHHDVAAVTLTDPLPDLLPPDLLEAQRRLGFTARQQLGNSLVVALHDPDRWPRIEALLSARLPGLRLGYLIATRTEIEQAIAATHAVRLRDEARLRCPEEFSSRSFVQSGARATLALAVAFVLLSAAVGLPFVVAALLGWVLIANTGTLILRLAAVLSLRWRRPHASARPAIGEARPEVTILLPVFGEIAVIDRLMAAIAAIDYPATLLDVIVLCEEEDDPMRDHIARMALPPFVRVMVVPKDVVQTKPRAMNYALPFATGQIVGIYDAEDRPEPDQVAKVVAHLAAAPASVGCVQAGLDFYNGGQNWLTRCFTLEYNTWFRVLLHGVQALRLPLPLGGTSVFFRRAVLEEVGAWDAHNVTEDAELGMRLARFGYRCEMIDSTTYEEANSRLRNWIGQRSRWLKGYCMTWGAHMRAPGKLWRELGPGGFLGFQVLFLGAITAYLAIPLFWIMALSVLAGWQVEMLSATPGWLWTALWISLPAGQVVMLTAVGLALHQRGELRHLPWAFTLPLYWPIGAIAAWRAVGELFVAPFHWRKTEHGLDGSQVQQP
ncbi:glycosyltransferase family 2 protein [Roseobacter sp. HKCCA0434]|uniref:glycosyltransferase family 2 protein n=1 Tax=Roseobacter sp. HKCCA0434 TaxID=3079297 RepID=UPI002905F033|nr:glycosyltransferase family 2 protein [Roseobacter sp. HKCCA0434]